MSNRWAKRSEESEVRVFSQLELLETLTDLPSGWSWTKAQELDQRLTTQLEFHTDLYHRLGVRPEPTAIKLFNQQMRRGQELCAIEADKARQAQAAAEQTAINSERCATRLSREQCSELQALWQITVTDDAGWFAGQARSLSQSSDNESEQVSTLNQNFHRGMVGSFGVRRTNGDAGANARLRAAEAALLTESSEHSNGEYWQ